MSGRLPLPTARLCAINMACSVAATEIKHHEKRNAISSCRVDIGLGEVTFVDIFWTDGGKLSLNLYREEAFLEPKSAIRTTAADARQFKACAPVKSEPE